MNGLEKMTGIYKNIKVKIWENEKDPSKYTIELFDYNDESVTWQELEAAAVSIGKECVTYENGGWTGCAIPEQRWDIAMEKLLKHKAFVEWEKSGAVLKIENVRFETEHYLEEISEKNFDIAFEKAGI